MANLLAIHSVGDSLVTYLRNSYPESLRAAHPSEFRLLSSGELAGRDLPAPMLSFFLYRVTANEHLRNTRSPNGLSNVAVPLSVDLHYLMTVWADSALAEHTILAWAMHQLHRHPVLDASSLSPEAEWGAGDFIHVIPAELSTEDIMRIWDAVEPPYRLSVSYIARVVRIEADPVPDALAVVASRFSWSDGERQP